MKESKCPLHRLGELVPIRFMPRIPSPLGKSAEKTYYGKKVRGESVRALLYLSLAIDQTMRQIRGNLLKKCDIGNKDWTTIFLKNFDHLLSKELSVEKPVDSINGNTRSVSFEGSSEMMPVGLLALINEGGLLYHFNHFFSDYCSTQSPNYDVYPPVSRDTFENESTKVTCPAQKIVIDTLLVALQANILLSRQGVPIKAGVITTTKPSPTNSFGRTWKSREEIIAEYEGIREQYSQAGI